MRHRKAIQIAKRALGRCVTPLGIIAGNHHFIDVWARDSLFASLGANVSGLSKDSQKTLETFLSYQRHNDLIPFLIRRDRLTIGKYFGRHSYYPRPKAQFRSSQSFGLVPDGGLMTVIAAEQYIDSSHDDAFLDINYPLLKNAMRWYTQKFGTELIREWFQCEWADAVLKSGFTLYTNVLYWKALTDMATLAKRSQRPRDATYFSQLSTQVAAAIRQTLWNGTYFADWADWFGRHDYFSSHGNMLAIVFGLTNVRETDRILAIANRYCWNGWTLETNYPAYPPWLISPLNIITGLADYHNRGCLWLQPGILYSIALYRAGYSKDAHFVLSRIAKKINEYDDVYEVYDKSGEPLHRALYQSEHPFAWSAGLFLWASHILGNV